MKRAIAISDRTRDSQQRAADPRNSIWVSANAGSGKTHVLTQRVLRLLLSGVSPESILCLTYTKAAAAEMRRRVSAKLAEWALMQDKALEAALLALEGVPPSHEIRLRARSLFAHALETPGGLKIVTIHAFCESVLHRFPLEARVPFDFSVIEDADQRAMILAAREGVMADGLNGHEALNGPVSTLFDLMSDFAIAESIDTALAEGRKLRPVLADRINAKLRLRKLVKASETSADILAEIVSGRLIGAAEFAKLFELTAPKLDGNRLEDKLARLDAQNPAPMRYMQAFLTADGLVPKNFPRKAMALADPNLADLCRAEAKRLQDLWQRLVKAALVERSEALLDVLGAISDRYEAQKRARSLLDFDDLIARLGDLFSNRAHADWVKYKLDAGITHILVDESQDTNPEQWRVVKAIADEFFAGDSAVQRTRTLFAVGDEKQSIYSFQGADPSLFDEQRRYFKTRADEANLVLEKVNLYASFRSLEDILKSVDLVFKRPELSAALLSDEGTLHEAAVTDKGGMVTLWPPMRQEADAGDENEWPLDAPKLELSAPRQIATRIAREIKGWVDSRRPLGPRGQAVTANDVLILVQSRNALFHEIIRALGKHNLPTPGADVLAVTTHIAVLDLLALGDVLLNVEDHLQLGALLRSPLFDVSEDELLAVAHNRKGSLWDAIAHGEAPSVQDAHRRLQHWRGRLDFERPYEFFAEILYAEGGLRRFHARLGPEVDDVFAQFLDMALSHEQTDQPSLQGFIAALRGAEISIKRELAETGSGVRVMTVHGAKGLEAPIVILADAATKPENSQLRKPVYIVPEAPGPLLIHASSSSDHVPETERYRDKDRDNQRNEYWRKLYVGMTRAEDELYVTGTLTKDGKLEGTWFEAIDMALRPESEALLDGEGNELALVYPRNRPEPKPVSGHARAVAADVTPYSPPPLPAPRIVPVVTPSSAYVPVDVERVYDTALDRVIDAEAARQRGIALHALLQHLGKVPEASWPLVIEKAMTQLLPDDPDGHAELAAKAESILRQPGLAQIFGPDSRAEVPFLVNGKRDGKPIRLAGRLDRLVVNGTEVLVVDYKSDAVVPETAQDVPHAYLTQLGLYALVATQLFPAHNVNAAILWTSMESLMFLPQERLAEAVSAFTLE
jgi:ATP-dependent helicase/nuclease subunit A